MAKFIVLEVDDDRTLALLAQKFTRLSKVRIAGVFARPTKWCACPHPEGYHKGQVALGARFGLWVCVVCKRPRMGTHTPFNLLTANELELPSTPMTMRVDHISIYEVPTDNLRGN